MSLQWTFVATFLYTELFLCVLLMLPFISPKRWQKIFKSKLLNAFRSYANIYFNVFILVLVVLFLDSIRDVRKYSDPLEDGADLKNNPAAEAVMMMKLFRSQRNFYIAGFALFLFIVLRRLVTLLSAAASMEAECEAAHKQALSATEAAKTFLENKDNADNEAVDEELMKKLESKKLECLTLSNDLARAQANLAAMKKQAEATNTEYDRLLSEHAKVQAEVDQLKGEEGAKKDN